MSDLIRTAPDRTSPDRTTLAIASMSAVALLLSALSLVLTTTDDSDAQQVQDRLACLELPGPNDCGADGR